MRLKLKVRDMDTYTGEEAIYTTVVEAYAFTQEVFLSAWKKEAGIEHMNIPVEFFKVSGKVAVFVLKIIGPKNSSYFIHGHVYIELDSQTNGSK